MLISIDTAKKTFPNVCAGFFLGSVTFASIFIFPIFGKTGISDALLFYIVLVFGFVGGGLGIYYKYLSRYGSSNVLLAQVSFFIVQIMGAAGTAAFAVVIAGRSDLKLLAVGTACLTLVISILLGIRHSAKKVKWWTAEAFSLIDKRFAKHINYSTRQFMPYPIPNSSDKDGVGSYGFLIVAAGTANIPLMFDVFTGQRFNAIFFAFPLLLGTFAYINFKNFGNGVLNLILLRKLEKSVGYRFINADLEQIQELRRTFFLSRWLMKDYVKPPSAAQAVQPNP